MLQAATGKICGCGGRLLRTVIFILSFEEPFIVNEIERCKFVSALVNKTPRAHLINGLKEVGKDYFRSWLTSAGAQRANMDEPTERFPVAVSSTLSMQHESSLAVLLHPDCILIILLLLY